MSRFTPAIGALGALLGVAGFIIYSLAPEHLWLVTLCEGIALIGLIVFFVAHFETFKAFSARRSTRLGFHSVLMVLLLAGILVIVNFLAARHAKRWDLSETQHFTLAPQTHRVLRSLNREVKVTVFAQERGQAFTTYRDLLDSYRQESDKIKMEFVDPERRPGVARQYGITRADTAVFESGTQSTRVTVPSEAELTGALIRISKDTKKQVLFLEGHGERSVADQEKGGFSTAKEALGKQGYEVDTLMLLKEQAVPENTSVLVLGGPRRPVTREEKDRIVRYVDGGGRLLVLLDPDSQADIDDLLKQWGIEAGRGILVDLQDRLAQGDLTALMVRTFTEHEITQDFTFAVLFPVSRHLAIREDPGAKWDIVPLARTSARSWAETNLTDLKARVYSFSATEDVQGPLPLAAALTPKKAPEEGKRRPAIVVVGNSAFASNAYINFPGNTDFLLHALGWLVEERELISITPKEPAFRPFIPNPAQERILLYVQVLLLPSVTFLYGMAMWRKRRRL
ncbi:MAG: Gldg family protein [Nitrospirae bacterium]|nr:Gldg family protein [Nitrospirota bacterium]